MIITNKIGFTITVIWGVLLVVFLALELLPIYREAFSGATPNLNGNEYGDLLGLAEHVKMEKLFDKYRHIWDKEQNDEEYYRSTQDRKRSGKRHRLLDIEYIGHVGDTQVFAQVNPADVNGVVVKFQKNISQRHILSPGSINFVVETDQPNEYY